MTFFAVFAIDIYYNQVTISFSVEIVEDSLEPPILLYGIASYSGDLCHSPILALINTIMVKREKYSVMSILKLLPIK